MAQSIHRCLRSHLTNIFTAINSQNLGKSSQTTLRYEKHIYINTRLLYKALINFVFKLDIL